MPRLITTMTEQARWSASLSDGSTLQEGKGDYQIIDGSPSPWRRLLSFAEAKGLTVTSLGLTAPDGRTFSLPSAGRNPKFRAFAAAPKPCGHSFFRAAGGDVIAGRAAFEDRFTVIAATYPDGKTVQLWVEDGTFNCWTLLS